MSVGILLRSVSVSITKLANFSESSKTCFTSGSRSKPISRQVDINQCRSVTLCDICQKNPHITPQTRSNSYQSILCSIFHVCLTHLSHGNSKYFLLNNTLTGCYPVYMEAQMSQYCLRGTGRNMKHHPINTSINRKQLKF